MKVLFTAFKGKNNSSKLLLDKINCPDENKLYLTNSFDTSVTELERKLNNNYDLVVSFGQLKLPKNVIRIEKNGIGDKVYQTKYDYSSMKDKLIYSGFNVVVSNRTNYLCNNIYYNGLKFIDEKGLNTQMVFIHIPKINVLNSVDLLAEIFNDYIN